jgi:hypothetical protein
VDSLIAPDFPPLFDEFRLKKWGLLWRGSRDGFGAGDFHRRCDGHANTLTLIVTAASRYDAGGFVFGGFAAVEWESPPEWMYKGDDSLKSFLFTLKNPHNIPARKFALRAEKKHRAIHCDSAWGPTFGGFYGGTLHDMLVSGNCDTNTRSFTELGGTYANDIGLDGKTVFTGSEHFKVKEIEVFEITD